jgi:hypothetical protein
MLNNVFNAFNLYYCISILRAVLWRNFDLALGGLYYGEMLILKIEGVAYECFREAVYCLLPLSNT